jgi:hypothetical protein
MPWRCSRDIIETGAHETLWKFGLNADVYSKAETDALLRANRNLISNDALAKANVTNLQTELNARSLTPSVHTKTHDLTIANVTDLQTELNKPPLPSAVYGKREIETTTANLIDNADVTQNTLNEIANTINNNPRFYHTNALTQGLETLVRPSSF